MYIIVFSYSFQNNSLKYFSILTYDNYGYNSHKIKLLLGLNNFQIVKGSWEQKVWEPLAYCLEIHRWINRKLPKESKVVFFQKKIIWLFKQCTFIHLRRQIWITISNRYDPAFPWRKNTEVWGQSSKTFQSPRFLACSSAFWHRVSGDWTNFKIPASPVYSIGLEACS